MEGPRDEKPKPAPNGISKLRSRSSQPVKPSDGTAAPAINLPKSHETRNRDTQLMALDLCPIDL